MPVAWWSPCGREKLLISGLAANRIKERDQSPPRPSKDTVSVTQDLALGLDIFSSFHHTKLETKPLTFWHWRTFQLQTIPKVNLHNKILFILSTIYLEIICSIRMAWRSNRICLFTPSQGYIVKPYNKILSYTFLFTFKQENIAVIFLCLKFSFFLFLIDVQSYKQL